MRPMKMIAAVKGAVSVIVILVFLLFPLISRADPRAVILYPSSASVTETTRVALQPAGGETKKVVLTLPGTADPDSLATRLAEGTQLAIMDQQWQKVSRTSSEKISKLHRQMQHLRDERITVQAMIQSLDAQIQFWQLQTKGKVKTTADAQNAAAVIGKNIRRLTQERLVQDRELEGIDKRTGERQEELNRLSDNKTNIREVAILLTGTHAGDAVLTYTYTLADCGWQPLYRLNAHPRTNTITFSREAEIWQSSGQDWNQVELTLATLSQPRTIHPPELPPWIVKTGVPALRTGHGKTDTSGGKAMAAGRAQAPEPQEERKSAYSLERLGRMQVPAGTRKIVQVGEASWPASFTYLAKPALDPQAFVRASIALPEPVQIPPGNAFFMLDGAMLGKRSFALDGREGTVFFGADPLVTVTSQRISQKSGEKTPPAGRQTYLWDWRVTIANGTTFPVRVRVEEPRPQVRNESIQLTVNADPPLAVDDLSLLIWTLDVPAGQRTAILYSIRLEAPQDLDLDLGWRK